MRRLRLGVAVAFMAGSATAQSVGEQAWRRSMRFRQYALNYTRSLPKLYLYADQPAADDQGCR